MKSPVIATADHSHSSSGYMLVADTSLLDALDGHAYWQHPSDRIYRHAPMVNDPFNSTVAELSRSAVTGKTVHRQRGEQSVSESILAAKGFQFLRLTPGFGMGTRLSGIPSNPNGRPMHQPMSAILSIFPSAPSKCPNWPQVQFLRGDIVHAKVTVERSYTRQQVWDRRRTPRLERPYFTPGFAASVPLLHGSRISSFDGEPTTPVTEATGTHTSGQARSPGPAIPTRPG